MFTAADFELFQPRFQGDPEWNARRLEIRHRLQALGDAAKAALGKAGLPLDRRESLHHPHHTNRKRVRRQRTMLFRDKASRRSLQRFLGKELGKDLDSAVNNLHFQCGLSADGAYWGLRIDSGAWYDLNVLVKRAEEEPGQQALRQAGQRASGFQLELDGGGARPIEAMSCRDWRDFAAVVRPGQSSLEVVRRWTVAEAVEKEDAFESEVVADFERLAPFYALSCWTLDGNSPSGVSL